MPKPAIATPSPGSPGPRPSLRERVGALRNIPPFLREIWGTSKPLTLASMGLRLVRALMPIVTLYIGKLIIDEAVRLVGAGIGFSDLASAWHGGALDHLALLLGAEFALAIASDLFGRLVSYCDGLLSELFTNATSIRLMEHAATLDHGAFGTKIERNHRNIFEIDVGPHVELGPIR